MTKSSLKEYSEPINPKTQKPYAEDDDIWDLLDAYNEKFPKDGLPVHLMPLTDEELVQLLLKCLREGKPHKIVVPEGCVL